MKLKTLLFEYDDKIAKYSNELGAYIKGLRPRVGKLKFNIEPMTGAWEWEDNKLSVYATLGWEGKKEVPIEIGLAPDGHEGDMVKTLKYNPKFDLKKDAQWYISNMKRYLPAVYKEYV